MLDFVKELTRRKVWLFGGIYLALGWVAFQVAIAIESTMKLPDWVDQSVLVLLALGFPFALLLAWAQESQGSSLAKSAKEDDASPVHSSGRPGHSIAVLAFDDLSPDGRFQEMVDGVSEDMLTAFSQTSFFSVAARHSSFSFKGTSPDIRTVGAELDVRYVIEGSIRSNGDKVRVTAQLIDALTGDHVWGKKYDHREEMLRAGLDDLSTAITAEVYTTVVIREKARLDKLDRSALSIADLRGMVLGRHGDFSEENLNEAIDLIEEILKRDPGHGQALAHLAQVHGQMAFHGFGDGPEHRAQALKYLDRAKAADTPDIEMLTDMVRATLMIGRREDTSFHLKQMRDQDPDGGLTLAMVAWTACFGGQYEEALTAGEKVKPALSARSEAAIVFLALDAMAHLGLGHFETSEQLAREYLSRRSEMLLTQILIAALGHQGKIDEARKILDGWSRAGNKVDLEAQLRINAEVTGSVILKDVMLKGMTLAMQSSEGENSHN